MNKYSTANSFVTLISAARKVKARRLVGAYMGKRHTAARKRHITYSRLANEAARDAHNVFYVYCDRADRADGMARMTWAILLERSLHNGDWHPCH
jgi:hypothetical protein